MDNSNTFLVEQAVFASADRGRVKGYQLVGQSPGIDREISQLLCRWSPTQMLSNAPSQWTLNCFPVADDFIAISRTLIGGPEYSNRGANQIVTTILLLRTDQFASYGFHAMAVAKTAMALGHLRLPLNLAIQDLAPCKLPVRPIVGLNTNNQRSGRLTETVVSELKALVLSGTRFAVIGSNRPRDLVAKLLESLPESARRSFSFTTGLAPAASRPFQAHFIYGTADTRNRRLLETLRLKIVEVRDNELFPTEDLQGSEIAHDHEIALHCQMSP